MSILRPILILTGVAAVGCSSDSSSDMTQAEFCVEWAKAACSKETVSVCQAEDTESCQVAQQRSCRDLVPKDGFSSAHANECLDAVSKAYQDGDLTSKEMMVVYRLGNPCDKLVAGPRDIGESCNANNDCNTAGGVTCISKGSSNTGVCEVAEVKQPGTSCAADAEICTSGFYCDGSHCVEGKGVSSSCEVNSECGSSAYCRANGDGSSTCELRLGVGSECTEDEACASGICLRGADEESGKCFDRLRLSPAEPACDDLS
ncbi:MAG: Dickkopf N-terminal cysteine-rich domain-containing protein [Polyangiaceae bacterium]